MRGLIIKGIGGFYYVKAEDGKVIETRGRGIFKKDGMTLCVGDEVEFELSQKGLEPYSTEGYDSKNWVLLDYSNVIVHVFVPNTRTYYDLEHLWADGEPIDISEYLTPDSTLE